jgi:hypothetical protein
LQVDVPRPHTGRPKRVSESMPGENDIGGRHGVAG